MKYTTKTERTFNIELTESEANIVRVALERLGANILTDEACSANKLGDIFDEMLQPKIKPNTTEVSDKLSTQEELTLYVKRLAPYSNLMIPKTIEPSNMKREENDIIQFMLGSKGQLGISFWDDENEYNNGKQAASTIWLNAECVHLLYEFIKNEGKVLGYMGYRVDDKSILEKYINNTGKISDDKKLKFVFNPKQKSVDIEKDGESINLINFETICLREFLGYHLGVIV